MWLACALIVLVSVGFVLPCMLDIAMTPDSEFPTLTKGSWLVIASAFWIFGAAAWLIAGRPHRFMNLRRQPAAAPYPPEGLDPNEALYRHPAGQSAEYYDQPVPAGYFASPLGPDDDEDFLLELDRRIRGPREDGTPEVF